MYYKGKTSEELNSAPFTVVCNNCGSHDVTIVAYDYHDLGIKCNRCGAFLGDYGKYNETDYKGE